MEILEGVEGLVHISELAQHHVENPREIVQPGDEVKVKILEIDSERRRLSLSIKRVEGQVLPRRTEGLTGDAGDLEDMPELGLSEDVFAEAPAAEPAADDELVATADDEGVAIADEAPVAEAPADEQDAPAAAPEAAEEEAPAAEDEAPAAEEE